MKIKKGDVVCFEWLEGAIFIAIVLFKTGVYHAIQLENGGVAYIGTNRLTKIGRL